MRWITRQLFGIDIIATDGLEKSKNTTHKFCMILFRNTESIKQYYGKWLVKRMWSQFKNQTSAYDKLLKIIFSLTKLQHVDKTIKTLDKIIIVKN